MNEFKIGDLVQFIPENFDRVLWSFCYIGIGFIESINYVHTQHGAYKIYTIYCGKVIKQQMKNFVEIEVKNATIQLIGSEMNKLCRLATLESVNDYGT